MILATTRVEVTADKRPEALRMLRVVMGHATARAGCLGFSIDEEVGRPEALTISGRWLTRDDLDQHVRSAEYRVLLAVIDMSVTPPEISFDGLDHIGGLELVEALRAPHCPPKEQ